MYIVLGNPAASLGTTVQRVATSCLILVEWSNITDEVFEVGLRRHTFNFPTLAMDSNSEKS